MSRQNDSQQLPSIDSHVLPPSTEFIHRLFFFGAVLLAVLFQYQISHRHRISVLAFGYGSCLCKASDGSVAVPSSDLASRD